MVRGCTGSAMSASTVLLVPRMVSSASCAAGPPEQLACMAAQDGTATELGAGLGADDRLGEGLGDALASPIGDALLRPAGPPAGEQPATAKIATTAASLVPTGNRNVRTRADVTTGIACTPFTIGAAVSGLNKIGIPANSRRGLRVRGSSERRVYRMKIALAVAMV